MENVELTAYFITSYPICPLSPNTIMDQATKLYLALDFWEILEIVLWKGYSLDGLSISFPWYINVVRRFFMILALFLSSIGAFFIFLEFLLYFFRLAYSVGAHRAKIIFTKAISHRSQPHLTESNKEK